MDSGMYEVGRWGVERASGRGVPARAFPHFRPESLVSLMRGRSPDHRPVVATDGFCPACGRYAPIVEYLAAVRRHHGYLVIDDTQALGIWGTRPSSRYPFGCRGGGSLRRFGCGGPDVLLVSSLAKGFGVPIAALSGSSRRIESFEARSATRVHCSPPSIPVIYAARHALDFNSFCGDGLRRRLWSLIQRFRAGLRDAGLIPGRDCFPVQTIRGLDAARLHSLLEQKGIRTVLYRARCEARTRIAFVINANHSAADVEKATVAIQQSLDILSGVSAGIREMGDD